MADGGFMVDLSALSSGIDQVSVQRDVISAAVQRVKSTFTNIEAHWVCPSGQSFVTVATHFNKLSDELVSLLDEAIGRMRTTYKIYLDTEVTNTLNYSSGGAGTPEARVVIPATPAVGATGTP